MIFKHKNKIISISTLWRSGLLSLLFFGFAISITYAQERIVTGKVTSDEEGALPGVNILIQGTGQSTMSDVEGNYNIVVPGPDAVHNYKIENNKTKYEKD